MPAADTNMISRVLLMQSARGPAAGFFLDRRRRQWLVTAGHLVPDDPVVELDLMLAAGRSPVALPRVPAAPGAAGIAVLALDEPLIVPDTSIEASNGGLLMGQDVHLFGYPLVGYGAWRTETGAVLPFVRHGCMGGTLSQSGTRMLLVDAISDAGMAGGPVTFAHDRDRKPHIAGVIVDPYGGTESAADDHLLRLPLGIIQVISIDHVTETIDAWKRR